MSGDNAPSWFEWITLFAIFFGPIAAVAVTRYVDGLRDKHSRKMVIFRSLMSTRRMKLSLDHVSALNLIEIEFYNKRATLEKWQGYVKHLSIRLEDAKRWNEVADELFTQLVQEIGRSLGYNIEQLAIFKGGYAPSGWGMVEAEHTEFRKLIIQVLRGERPFPIMTVHSMQGNPMFPPPPEEN